MAKKPGVKKRQPTDATLRNVRAARAREVALKKRVAVLEEKVGLLNLMVEQLVTQQQMVRGATD